MIFRRCTTPPCQSLAALVKGWPTVQKTNGITAEPSRIDGRKARWPNRERAGNTMAKTVNSASNPPMQAGTQCVRVELTWLDILAQWHSVALGPRRALAYSRIHNGRVA